MKAIHTLMLAPLMLASCAGGWHDEDKAKLRADCMRQSAQQVGDARANAYCDCFVEKMVNTYPVFNDFLDHMNLDTVDRLKAQCREENGL